MFGKNIFTSITVILVFGAEDSSSLLDENYGVETGSSTTGSVVLLEWWPVASPLGEYDVAEDGLMDLYVASDT